MSPNTIPDKLPGTVLPQYVRCGRPECDCAQGKLHGPYWYRLYRDADGRKHKKYVRPADLAQVRAACARRQQEMREVSDILARGPKVVALLSQEEASALTECGPGKMTKFSLAEMKRQVRGTQATQGLEDLFDCATGLKGNARTSTRAFEILAPLMVQMLTPAEAEQPQRVPFDIAKWVMTGVRPESMARDDDAQTGDGPTCALVTHSAV